MLLQLENEISTLHTQCDNLHETIQNLDSKFIVLAKKAEELNELKYLVGGNALKRKSEEKNDLLSNLKRRLVEVGLWCSG